MKNNVETFTHDTENLDLSLNKKIKFNEKTNSKINKRKVNCFLLILFIILIIIIIIFLCLFFSRRKKVKNIIINKIQISNSKIICESGFYLPLDDPLASYCKKCSIENCIECYGSKIKDICLHCNPEFKEMYINNKIESCEIPCEEGINEKCKQCDNDNNKCSSCNDGYYLPDFEKNKCQKCSIDNCLKCYGNKTSNNCTKCNSNLKEGYESGINRTIISCKLPCEEGTEDKCKRCDNIRNECIECNVGYKLVNDKCILNYSFKAKYKQNSANETIKLINIGSIIEMNIDGKKVEPSSVYSFNDTKSHEIYALINMKYYGSSLENAFYYIKGMISISFTSLFDTSKITNMAHMFCNSPNLESINIKSFDMREVKDISYLFHYCYKLYSIVLPNFTTNNIINLSGMFYYCFSLKSIDLSSFETKSVTNLNSMFYNCQSLISIDLSSFDTKSVTNLNSMFYNCQSLKSIDLSNFDTKKVSDMNKIFYYCINLTYINIVKFFTNSTVSLFNKNLPPKGTIKANQNIYSKMDSISNEAIAEWTKN